MSIQLFCKLAGALAAALALLACSQMSGALKLPISAPCTADDAQPHRSVWFPAGGADPARGVFLIVHGLNNRPGAMDSLIGGLNQRGFHALRLTLTGHDGTALEKHAATPAAWLADFHRARCRVERRHPNLPLYNLSYSTGAAVTAAYIQAGPSVGFRKLVLLAPAIKLRRKSQLIRSLTPLRQFDLALPSLAAPDYRAYSSTSLDSYHSLFALSDSLQQPANSRLAAAPALVLLSERDELISYADTESWVRRHQLPWRLERLAPQAVIAASYQHLILDRQTLGAAEWLRLWRLIDDFLED